MAIQSEEHPTDYCTSFTQGTLCTATHPQQVPHAEGIPSLGMCGASKVPAWEQVSDLQPSTTETISVVRRWWHHQLFERNENTILVHPKNKTAETPPGSAAVAITRSLSLLSPPPLSRILHSQWLHQPEGTCAARGCRFVTSSFACFRSAQLRSGSWPRQPDRA